MTALFFSHSSKDDAQASSLGAWFKANEVPEVFIDHESIPGATSWADALRDKLGASRVVACLVTENWLASDECTNEFLAAWYMGKRILPLFARTQKTPLDDLASKRLARISAEFQGLDVAPYLDAAGGFDVSNDEDTAAALRQALRAAGVVSGVGLDPYAFAMNRDLRPIPFPGLASFGDEDADAALFFGRSRALIDTLQALRAIRAAPDGPSDERAAADSAPRPPEQPARPRLPSARKPPLVILGASGAGKSSLMKAGLIPRLRREAPAWIPLRAFRPGADPLLNFARAITQTLEDFGVDEAHGTLRRDLLAVWQGASRDSKTGALTEAGWQALRSRIDSEGQRLRAKAHRPHATLLLSVDQGEELARSEGDSGDALADYVRAALASTDVQWQTMLTVRSDSFGELQAHPRFRGLEVELYDLRPLPVFRFDNVIEEPARRYGIQVDPELVYALMGDAPEQDALPLLAFALQRLWDQFHKSGKLTEDDYRSMGGLQGLIRDAAERALFDLPPEVPLPSGAGVRKSTDALGARTFVPALVDLNDKGEVIRREADSAQFDDDGQGLLARFERWRLVVRKADQGKVEVAHEALLRTWDRLSTWLEPERARLEALRGLQAAARTWIVRGKTEGDLVHFGVRLREAAALLTLPRYDEQLVDDDRRYLEGCENAEGTRRRQQLRQRRTVMALVATVFLATMAFVFRKPLDTAWTSRAFWLYAQSGAALKPGDLFQDCDPSMTPPLCPKMVVVPAGDFEMGDEEDGRPVTIAEPFAVGQTEVTFDEWQVCVERGGPCKPTSDLAGGVRGRRPIINVRHDEAVAYAVWLSEMTGKAYRLLSEAEWEYVARAGTTTAYSWGDDIGTNRANCNGCGSEWDDKSIAPVASFEPNGFGLYDVHGNV